MNPRNISNFGRKFLICTLYADNRIICIYSIHLNISSSHMFSDMVSLNTGVLKLFEKYVLKVANPVARGIF